jgi:hypothetical protein
VGNDILWILWGFIGILKIILAIDYSVKTPESENTSVKTPELQIH